MEKSLLFPSLTTSAGNDRDSRSRSGGAIMVNLLQIVRDHWVHVLVPMGFVIGYYLDTKSDERLTAFRNKSMLFKRDLQPSEEVTWK
ncbi:NADH dehydrogenase [ubiquinone] 1 beta subcomplex subunit 1 isoform X2 [Symphalangus syndactylus]|uniref:NADH dehydrogenase [ubiquinone] 1 beta subcomplex subunit 1 isoform X2 n=1 Tax=Symphalangus syndactylus TaxID=9590 RepID=UPI0024420EEE|nr:NADH dehydrogenase [ubiquinone] 1 beta subcomplex subunit 1 isoform X2 [Symphalangus syndactylus]